ncbi:MAG: hypothetical protein V1725_02710 [archaeon]
MHSPALSLGCQSENQHPALPSPETTQRTTFNLEQFVIKRGATVRPSELGTLLDTQEAAVYLNAGGQENGTIEFYDADGNKYPDVMVFRRANGDIVSIGLDYGSDNYTALKNKLGNRITPYTP